MDHCGSHTTQIKRSTEIEPRLGVFRSLSFVLFLSKGGYVLKRKDIIKS